MPGYTIMKTIYLRGLLWLYLLSFFYTVFSLEPGFLDFDNLPDTNFSCVGKVIGGYYADLETNCQMFHVCTIGQLDEPMDIRFLCLNGTVFDQETRVCERIDEVDCSKSEQFYSLNLELYGNTQPSILEENSETDPPIIIKASTTTTTTTTTTQRPKPKTTRTYFTTPTPAVTTVTKVISSHHFPISGQTDIRFNPEEINISLNPGAPPNIRKPVSYHQQVFSDNNKKVVVTTHTTYGTPDKDEILRIVPNTQRPVASTQKQPPATPADINYGFTYHHTEKTKLSPQHNYQYHHANFRHGQFRDQFKTTERATTRHTTTFRTPYQYRTEKPQRLQLPIPLLPTLPPLTFSSPAPFSLGHHIEAKRYTNDHQPPRIIISASASVSDASGRRLNYSLGTIGVTPLLEQPPKSYDDYKDHDDVVLDPFYHDVPKIKQKRKKRQVNHSEVIKNEQEAVDVLKFLFDWYRNHERTSTIKVPIDAEDITEINQELAAIVESPISENKSEVNFRESALFQKKNKFNIVGDVLSVTEKEKNVTIPKTTSVTTKLDTEDYVDDNYEAVTYSEEVTTTEIPTTTTPKVRVRTRGHKRSKNERQKYSAGYWTNLKPEMHRRGRARNSKSTTTEALPEEEKTLKEESQIVEVSETEKSETKEEVTEIVSEETTILIPEETKVKNEATTLQEESQIFSETSTFKKNSDLEDDGKLEERNGSFDDFVLEEISVETTTQKLENITEETETESLIETTTEKNEENLLEGETTEATTENTTQIEEKLNKGEDNLTKSDISENYETVTEEALAKLDELESFKNLTEEVVTESLDLGENNQQVENLEEHKYEEKVSTKSETLEEEKHEEQVLKKPLNFEEKKHEEDLLKFDEKHEEEVLIKPEVSEENKPNEEVTETETVTSDSTTESVSTVSEFHKEYLHESEHEKTTFATTDIGPTVTFSETEYKISTSSSTTPTTTSSSTTTTTTEIPEIEVLTDPDPTNLTPAETTTSETSTIPRGRRRRPSRPRNRRPNPRHRFSTELFTSRPTRRKPPIEENNITSLTQLTTTEITSTSPTTPTIDEIPATDAPLFKSANPTQAESAKESLHTTPLSMTYKLSVRKEKLKSYIFNCFGKPINKFYSDPRDCRLFHYCTSGYTRNQLLDMKFVCDLGTYFDDEKLICTKDKPERCL